MVGVIVGFYESAVMLCCYGLSSLFAFGVS
ncbi:MAG: hypothetical protein HLUCCA11_22945 [Phormidesmis priestleyi Ana]|uniref:Uncharacterized protein n=1 Tax=Phormidesmis priestleyi Ana TaxID=1666911 RepID=A0A0P8D6W5_9CYAN|nr:MAG: hypothetical protein HLUCCA11_22945 [Phormidesmis priestleyi Ana]